jgi:uncharacterized damage-inducible protein DinB
MTETNSSKPRSSQNPEPWLRGTKQNIPAVPRAVLHALELAAEDLHRWCAALTTEELNSQPHGLPSVVFQLKHIAGSLDRLLTYAEARQLDAHQLTQLHSESTPTTSPEEIFTELSAAIGKSETRILTLSEADLNQPRAVGKRQLPTTLGGLLVHVADHTQRHVGQAITTAKLLHSLRDKLPDSSLLASR